MTSTITKVLGAKLNGKNAQDGSPFYFVWLEAGEHKIKCQAKSATRWSVGADIDIQVMGDVQADQTPDGSEAWKYCKLQNPGYAGQQNNGGGKQGARDTITDELGLEEAAANAVMCYDALMLEAQRAGHAGDNAECVASTLAPALFECATKGFRVAPSEFGATAGEATTAPVEGNGFFS